MRYFFTFFALLLCLHITSWGQNYQILGLGAPCMDIVIAVDDAAFKKLGSIGGSQQITYETFQTMLKEAKSQSLRISSGGSCSNTIKGLSLLDHRCAIFGKMGRDDLGLRYLSEMQRSRVLVLSPYSSSLTQVCVCFVAPDGNRTMRCFPGASNEVVTEELKQELFNGVKLVHVEGYALYIQDKNYLTTALTMAKAAGAKISMDLSSFELVKLYKDELLKIIPKYVDILFANADEVKALTGLEPLDACIKLKNSCPIVVVMVGKKGCLVGAKNFLHSSMPASCKVLDTTGAGDLFASGFLHAYLAGKSLEECASLGCELGAAVCEVYGTDIPQEKWLAIKAEYQTLLVGKE